MKTHTRKLMAPVIITAFCLIWFLGWIVIAFLLPIPGFVPALWVKLLAAVLPLALTGVSIYCLVERVREVKSGEEDDLDRY